jgi:hypothetical protein
MRVTFEISKRLSSSQDKTVIDEFSFIFDCAMFASKFCCRDGFHMPWAFEWDYLLNAIAEDISHTTEIIGDNSRATIIVRNRVVLFHMEGENKLTCDIVARASDCIDAFVEARQHAQ